MRIGLLTAHPKTYNVKRLVDELRAKGHIPVIINYLGCYANISKSNPQVFYKGKRLSNLDAVMPQIAVPHTEFGVSLIRQFEMMGTFTTVGSLALARARDKVRQLQIFSKNHIDIPKSAFAHASSDATELINLVGGAPLVIKVTMGSQGNGVMLAETNRTAKPAIEAFLSQSVNILVQEYVEESEGKDIRIIVIDGKIIASMQRTAADGEFRSNIYKGGEARPVKLTRDERQLAIMATKLTGLHIAGVDIIQSERGPLVTEVNAYPNMEGIETTTNANVAGAIVDYIEKNSSNKIAKDKVGA